MRGGFFLPGNKEEPCLLYKSRPKPSPRSGCGWWMGLHFPNLEITPINTHAPFLLPHICSLDRWYKCIFIYFHYTLLYLLCWYLAWEIDQYLIFWEKKWKEIRAAATRRKFSFAYTSLRPTSALLSFLMYPSFAVSKFYSFEPIFTRFHHASLNWLLCLPQRT